MPKSLWDNELYSLQNNCQGYPEDRTDLVMWLFIPEECLKHPSSCTREASFYNTWQLTHNLSRCREQKTAEFPALNGTCLTFSPFKAQGSLRKRRHEGCKNQRWQMTTRKYYVFSGHTSVVRHMNSQRLWGCECHQCKPDKIPTFKKN